METIKNPFTEKMIPAEWLGPDERGMLTASLSYFDDIDCGMTDFQITHFVLSDKDFPTAAAKYFQARKELFVRYTNLVNGYQECRELEAEMGLLDAQIMEIEGKDLTPTKRALAHLFIVKREKKAVRVAFVKKEASRQVREMQSFWRNHQHYGAMLRPGVTQELAEPEKWSALAAQPIRWWERVKMLVTGHAPRPVELKQFLNGPMARERQHLSHQLLDPQRENVLKLNGGQHGPTR